MQDYYIPGRPELDKTVAKRTFSRIGWAFFAMMLISQGMAIVIALGVQLLAMGGSVAMINLLQSEWLTWLVSTVPNYVFGLPVFLLILRRLPNDAPAPRRRVTIKQMGGLFLISYAMLYVLNIFGMLLTQGIGLLRGKDVANILTETVTGSSPWLVLLFAVFLAPVVEEFVFRGVLLNKMRRYGEPLCIFASGFIFGLFHGNLNQMFYAFGVGCIFAYVTLRSGSILYSTLLHIAINFCGSFLPLVIEGTGSMVLVALFGMVVMAVVICGALLLFRHRKKLHFSSGEYTLPEGEKRALFLKNSGMIAYMVLCAALILYTTFFYG